MPLDILFEDEHCLVVNKPAGLLSQADETGDMSLVSWAQEDLRNSLPRTSSSKKT